MKNSTNRILVAAVVLLLAANLVMVYMMVKQKNRRGVRKEQKGGGPMGMMKELNLSEEQKNTFEQLKDEHFKNSRPLFDSVRAAKIAYFNLVKDTTVSDSTIREFGDRVREKQAAADQMLFDHFRNVRRIFTPDQRLKFDSLVQKSMMQRGGKRKGN